VWHARKGEGDPTTFGKKGGTEGHVKKNAGWKESGFSGQQTWFCGLLFIFRGWRVELERTYHNCVLPVVDSDVVCRGK